MSTVYTYIHDEYCQDIEFHEYIEYLQYVPFASVVYHSIDISMYNRLMDIEIRDTTPADLGYVRTLTVRNDWSPVFMELDSKGTVVLKYPRIPEGLRQSLYRKYTKKGRRYISRQLPGKDTIIILEPDEQATQV